jgi:hypothetical protein
MGQYSRKQKQKDIERSEFSTGHESTSQMTTFRQNFLERNEHWLQRKEDKLKRYREIKNEDQWEGCTFMPETQPYSREKPNELLETDLTTDYKIVFSGQTFDLSSATDLKNFFTKSIEKSGQRSIFKHSYDKQNKIYSNMLN